MSFLPFLAAKFHWLPFAEKESIARSTHGPTMPSLKTEYTICACDLG